VICRHLKGRARAFLRRHREVAGLLVGILGGVVVGEDMLSSLLSSCALLWLAFVLAGRQEGAQAAACGLIGLLIAVMVLGAVGPPTAAQLEIRAKYGVALEDAASDELIEVIGQSVIAMEFLIFIGIWLVHTALDLWRNGAAHLARWGTEGRPTT